MSKKKDALERIADALDGGGNFGQGTVNEVGYLERIANALDGGGDFGQGTVNEIGYLERIANYLETHDGSDSGDSTVVIYDGDVELTYADTFYTGLFTTTNEPQSENDINVSFNNQTYHLQKVSDHIWADSTTLENANIVVDKQSSSEYAIVVLNVSILPSADSPQTISVQITQEQSESGSGDNDFSIANVTFKNSGSSYTLTCSYVDEDYVTLDRYGITSEMTFQIPLYKGLFILGFDNFENVDFSVTPTISGAIRMAGSQFEITGDGAITMEGNANSPTRI